MPMDIVDAAQTIAEKLRLIIMEFCWFLFILECFFFIIYIIYLNYNYLFC